MLSYSEWSIYFLSDIFKVFSNMKQPILLAQSLSTVKVKLILRSEFSPGGSRPIFGEIERPISLENGGYLIRSGENNFESII